MNQLTKQQQTVYDYIRGCMMARGFGPTVREIGEHMRIKSPNGVMCHLRALEKKGMIRRSANKSRAIELTEGLPRGELSLDVVGWISGGVPRSAEGSPEQLSLSRLLSLGEHFVLEARDESLLELQIQPGDYLVIRRQSQAPPEQLVLAEQLDGATMVLGHVQSRGGLASLQPLVAQSPPVSLADHRLIGSVMGVVRLFAGASELDETGV